MSFQAALIVAFFVIFTAVFVVLARLTKGSIQAKEEDLSKAATLRGWTFEKLHERGVSRLSLHAAPPKAWRGRRSPPMLVAGGNQHRRRRHIARWHGEWSPGVTRADRRPSACRRARTVVTHLAGARRRLLRASGGRRRPASHSTRRSTSTSARRSATRSTPARCAASRSAAVPGFIVMAGNVDEAIAHAVRRPAARAGRASSTPGNVLVETDRPYVLVRPQGISLARMEQFRNVAELDRFVHAGIGLTRRFGLAGARNSSPRLRPG